jgi:Fe-S oxidoreductase
MNCQTALPINHHQRPVKPPVLLFIDSFNRYFEPENIRAAVRVLQAAGYDVFTPMPDGSKQPLCCGRTFLSTGMIDRARHEARPAG